MMKNKNHRLMLVGFLCFGVAAGLYFFPQTPPHGKAGDAHGTLFFPDLMASYGKIAKVRYVFGAGLSGTRTLTFNKHPEQNTWHFEQRGGHRVSLSAIRKVMEGLAGLTRGEKYTNDPKYHSALGLRVPEKLGRAVRLEVYDTAGKPLASILLGKRPQGMHDMGASGAIYARYSDNPQAWIAWGDIPLWRNPGPWLAASLPALSFEQVVTVRHGATVVAAENTPQLRNFMSSYQALEPKDVRPLDSISWKGAVPRRVELRNGVAVNMLVLPLGTGAWVKLQGVASAKATKPARAMVAAMNKNHENWAYYFPSDMLKFIMNP